MTQKEKAAQYYQANKLRYKSPEHEARRKAYRDQNKERIKTKNQEHYIKNKDCPKLKERQSRYYQEHKHVYYPRQKERRKERIQTDPNYKLTQALRHRVYGTIKNAKGKKSSKTLKLLGCSLVEARNHIEQQWQSGMSWDNYGVFGWHIDHIKPCCTFDLTDPEQQEQCFHYTNLRPLWAADNLSRPKRG